MAEREEILSGGNMTAVVRVGNTVRRAAGPWTPTIHAFLRHLRANGFDLVPDALGMDDQGREILSLLPGARVLDLAYAAYRFVPLTDPANPDAPFPGQTEQRRRLNAFCIAYGGVAPEDVPQAAAAKLRELVAFIEREAAAGDPAQQAVHERGDVAIYKRDVAYLDEFSRGLRSTDQPARPRRHR